MRTPKWLQPNSTYMMASEHIKLSASKISVLRNSYAYMNSGYLSKLGRFTDGARRERAETEEKRRPKLRRK